MALVVFLTALQVAAWAGIVPGNFRKGRAEPLNQAIIISLFFAAQTLATGLAYFLADLTGVRNILSHKSGHSASRKASALYLFMIAYSCLLLALSVPVILVVQSLTPRPDTGLTDLYAMMTEAGLRTLLPCGLLLVLWAPFLGWIMKREHEQYEKWGKLEIDE